MKYFENKIDNNLKFLYQHRFLSFIANGFFGAFGLVFLYKLFDNNLKELAIFFAITSIGYTVVMPFLKFGVNRIGFDRVLVLGWFFNIFTIILYYLLSLEKSWVLIFLLGIAIVLFRTSYWVSFHTELASFSKRSDRGKTVALMMILSSFISLFLPIISGYILKFYNFSILYMVGIIGFTIAIIPLFWLKDKTKKISWDVKDFWKKYFSPKDKKFRLAIFARGLETSVGIVVWPIFIYELLDGDLLKLGYFSSIITIFVILINLIQGKILDKKKNNKFFIKYSSWLYSLAWILKIFGITAFYISIVDIFQRIISNFSFMSFDALVYDYTADKGDLVDEWTILKEMWLHSGKAFGFLIIAFSSVFVSMNYLFVIAALAVLIINLIPDVNKEGL